MYSIQQSEVGGWDVVLAAAGGWRSKPTILCNKETLAQAAAALINLLDDEDEEKAWEAMAPEKTEKAVIPGAMEHAWQMATGLIEEAEKRQKERDAMGAVIEKAIVSLSKGFTDIMKRPPATKEVLVSKVEETKAPKAEEAKVSSSVSSSYGSIMTPEQKERLEKKKAEAKARIEAEKSKAQEVIAL